MSGHPYFRPGAGAIVYNDAGEVLVFERSDIPGVWQFPQGGMDTGETIEDTLWRELAEETGLHDTDFSECTPYPHYTVYAYPADVLARVNWKDCLGQVHRWFFLKLKPESILDLDRAAHEEFIDFKWVGFESFLSEASPLKQAIYTELYDFFITEKLVDKT